MNRHAQLINLWITPMGHELRTSSACVLASVKELLEFSWYWYAPSPVLSENNCQISFQIVDSYWPFQWGSAHSGFLEGKYTHGVLLWSVSQPLILDWQNLLAKREAWPCSSSGSQKGILVCIWPSNSRYKIHALQEQPASLSVALMMLSYAVAVLWSEGPDLIEE